MIHPTNLTKKINEIIEVANKIIEKKINVVEGIRKIVSLRHSINSSQDDLFHFFIAFDSETDHFPIGDVRKNWNKESLEKADKEINKYILDSEDATINACFELIDKLSRI